MQTRQMRNSMSRDTNQQPFSENVQLQMLLDPPYVLSNTSCSRTQSSEIQTHILPSVPLETKRGTQPQHDGIAAIDVTVPSCARRVRVLNNGQVLQTSSCPS